MDQLTLLEGDCRQMLKTLPEQSVQCCVTSPPYWGLRDYGHGEQIGLEGTPEAYVEQMVTVFREVRRVLRDDGTLWLNLGDTIKDKQLQGIPWRVAFALQADGWWLRQDIIWSKPNPMPESVTDRCTKAHEYIFLLSKSSTYFYDAEAVKEKSIDKESIEGRRPRKHHALAELDPKGFGATRTGFLNGRSNVAGMTYPTRNRRSVWHVATKPYSGAHFATFPPALITPCILAGTSAKGCCSKCGAPWDRVVERTAGYSGDGNPLSAADREEQGNQLSNDRKGANYYANQPVTKTTGWQPSCDCEAESTPCVVLDPFNGAGTTGVVARDHGRRYIGCELNPEYAELSRRRWAGLTPEEPDDEPDEDGVRQGLLFG